MAPRRRLNSASDSRQPAFCRSMPGPAADKLHTVSFSFHGRRSHQSGYVLMVIMFFIVLMVIGLLATAPTVKTQIQREREEEMIHRGAQYSRAIKKYFKKYGRYPTSIDQLKETSNLRFLRKEYKDPMSADGKWRLLHLGENLPGLQLGSASNVGTPVSALGTLGGAAGNVGKTLGGQSSPGGAAGTLGAAAGALGGSTASGLAGAATSGQPSTTGGVLGAQGTSGSSSSTSAFGGGAIIGVASVSEKQGLHEFNEKTHYNEWYFVYDPTTDRGGLIKGPYTGKTFAAVGGIGTPAGAPQTGAPGTSQPSAFGQPSSFGRPGGMSQQTPPQQPPNPR